MLALLSLLITCSPPPPGFHDTRPPAGSMIPSNAEIVLVGHAFGTPQVTITQIDAIYEVTPIIEQGTVRVDVGALDLRGPITLVATALEPFSSSVAADLTIVDAADTAPPEFEGIDQITYEFVEDQPGFCTPGGFAVRVHLTPGRDDWGVTHYLLFEVLPNDAQRWAGSTVHSDGAPPSILTFAGQDEGTRCYVAAAVDVGGNMRSAPGRGGVCVDLRRNPLDAGVTDSSIEDSMPQDTGLVDTGVKDAGTIADAGRNGGDLELDDGRGCGCAATVQSTAHSIEILPLLVIVVLLTAGRRIGGKRTRAESGSNRIQIEEDHGASRNRASRSQRRSFFRAGDELAAFTGCARRSGHRASDLRAHDRDLRRHRT